MAPENVNPGQAGGGPGAPLELAPVDESAALNRPVKPNPFLTRGNLLLLGMFAVGIAGVYVLSLRNGPTRAMAEQNLDHAKVEAALNVLASQPILAANQKGSTARAIVNEFYTAARQRQVPTAALACNPFVFQAIEANPQPDPNAAEQASPKDKGPDEAALALKAAQALHLQSVVDGEPKMALISGNPMTVGQTINGWTVARIGAREVELTWKDQTFVLQMP